MGFLELFFGGKKSEIQRFLKQEALILDVRTLSEFKNDHIKESLHIPLNELHNKVEELRMLNKPFIVCCESGVRSAKAAKFLNLNNLKSTNGGGWLSLSRQL